MAILKWTATKEEHEHIMTLAKLTVSHAAKNGIVYRLQEAGMDITAAHANGNPLKLAEMVAAIGTENESDVLHDLFGIRRHIDRSTGKLGDCFSPRYSQPEGPTAQERREVQETVDRHFHI